MADRVGQQLGNYQLIRLLGEGGFAEVYLGEHIHLGTQAAIKVLHTQLTSDDVNKFRIEARTIAHLIHPHIVRVLEFGVEGKTPFLVMDYAPNGTVRQRHPKGVALPLPLIVAYVKQVADALQYAHDEKLIHRDIKPENILLGRRNDILLSDFGIALVAQSSRYQSAQEMAGTMAYMAPEQMQGKPRPASDQYSLGIVVYEWLSGDRPFHGSLSELVGQHLSVLPASLQKKVPTISPEIEQVVLRALAKEPKDRFDHIAAFGIALENAYTSSLLDAKNIDALEPLQRNHHNNINDKDIEFAPSLDNNSSQYEEVFMMPSPPLPIPIDNTDKDADSIEDDLLGENDNDILAIVANNPAEKSEDSYIELAATAPLRKNIEKRNSVEAPYQTGDAGIDGRGFAGAMVVPPTTGNRGIVGGSHRKRSGRQLLLLALTTALLVSLLLCGGIALAAPSTLRSAFDSLQHFGSNTGGVGTSTATITITPKSALLSNTYILAGIPLGTPDPSKRQVQARQLTFTTKAQAKTVSATDQKQTAGTHATGTITFYNSSTSAFYVAADSVFTDGQGRQFANDALVGIPAGNPSTGTYGFATASAHAVAIGASGNIPAGDITNTPCCGDAAVGINTNSAFTGGQDPQNYTFVQQSDVDTVANSFKQSVQQSAQTALDGLKHANELFVSKPQCTNNVSSNPNIGDKATSVTVSVSATCTDEVYDQVGAETIAANLLKGEADKDTGGNYVLSGNVLSSLTSVTADSKGDLTLLVKAQGVWVYQFDQTAKTMLAKLIVGKSQNDATALLLQQAGVSKVDGISFSNRGKILPSDFNQISIVVQPIAGVQGTPTVGTGVGSPTPKVSPGANAIPTTKPPTIIETVQGSWSILQDKESVL